MKDLPYLRLVIAHVLLGILIYALPALSVAFGLLIFLVGLVWVFRNSNANEEALLVCAYLVGSEVFLRMTKGTVNHEFTKYSIMILLALGMYFKGFSKNAVAYGLFFILLLPGIVLGMIEVSEEERFRQIMMFNLSGPLSLIIASIYCYSRKISFAKLQEVLLWAGLPIVSCATYLVLYTPDLKEVLINTGSNFATSGGFGPNQVATILGFGMFVFFSRLLLASPTKLQLLVNSLLVVFLTYRGLLTFSRGGVITGFFMIALLVGVVYLQGNSNARFKMTFLLGGFAGALFLVWLYTSLVTSGLIDKRYANQDAQGREKQSLLSGREGISITEIELFLENPFFGGGVGSGTVYRKAKFDLVMASHNEITRMLGEHGLLGILGLLILLFTPLLLYLDNKYHYFILCFMAFWFLTLNHAAMRTAAPSFIYALSLLKVGMHEKTFVFRKRVIPTRH
ncbi:O-antigen ligase family protein [Flavobacterium sp.]|uniref:O-antigen ligase family protein n=1 Tax=Flavobacterium sp. TaxID=239 RepID=UPI002FD96BAD